MFPVKRILTVFVFLLVVGASLYYFANTIFENQQRSRAISPPAEQSTIGTWRCWGGLDYYDASHVGVVNFPTINSSANPITVIDQSAGEFHTCAVTEQNDPQNTGIKLHKVACYKDIFALPSADPLYTTVPESIASLTNVRRVSSGESFNCVLLADKVSLTDLSNVLCWTDGGNGNSNKPITDRHFRQISSAMDSTCAVDTNNNMSCWGGAGPSIQFPGYVNSSSVMAEVDNVQIGRWHGCALKRDGSVVCWGGTTSNENFGQHIVPSGVANTYDNVKLVSMANASCVLKENGSVLCWGQTEIRRGNNTIIKWYENEFLPNIQYGISSIAADGDDTGLCATFDSGYIKCYGEDYNGHKAINPAAMPPLDVVVGGSFACSIVNTSSPNPPGGYTTCDDILDCSVGDVCVNVSGENYCLPGITPGATPPAQCVTTPTPGENDNLCGYGYHCNTATDPDTCDVTVCSTVPGQGVVANCLTATPTSTQTPTPSPTPYAGAEAPVCIPAQGTVDDLSNCNGDNSRPYYVLTDNATAIGYDLRYYNAVTEIPPNINYHIYQNGAVKEPPTTIYGQEFVNSGNSYLYKTIPFNLLHKITIPDLSTNKNINLYVSEALEDATPAWYVKTEVVGSDTFKVYLRSGLTEDPPDPPTPTYTPTVTPTGFNLYIDPVGTDPVLDAVQVKLETGVRKGARRGEVFAVRVVASPEKADFRSEYIFLKELKVPMQYALPVNPNSIILESIQSTNNPDCADYTLEDPQQEEIGTISAFYLRALYNKSKPKQLAAGTCVAEFTFSVRQNAQYNDTARLKLLTESESVGIGEVDIVPQMRGMHALAYHLTRSEPATTPAVTPATIHPKVNISYDMPNREKVIAIDTSRFVAATDPPDLVLLNAEIIRLPLEPGETCGKIRMRVAVKNSGGSTTDQFKIAVNDSYRFSSSYYPQPIYPELPTIGLANAETKYFIFSNIKFNNDGPNFIAVDWAKPLSNDSIVEIREDNNYLEKKFVYADIQGNSNTQCPNPTNTLTPTPTPTSLTPTPTRTLDPTKINLKLLVKLQGVGQQSFSSQYSRLKMGVAIGGGTLTANTPYVYEDFEYKGAGVYAGIVTFDPAKVPVGSNYKIIVKGPKHLAKRFCITNPDSQAYYCPATAGSISLATGLTEISYASVPLVAGDIPNSLQDGVVDSSDLSFIRMNLGVKSPAIIRIGDLNLDGIIDTQDYSMVINNLINNVDEN